MGLLFLGVACGELEDETSGPDEGAGPSSSASSGGEGGSGAGESSTGGSLATSTSSSSGAGVMGGSATGSTGTGMGPGGLDELGSLVVLGDSISDGGGQGPYYYDVLLDSLTAQYGHAIDYRNRAQSGSKTSALLSQIQGLPSSLPGPVAVTITSGGNDFKDNLVPIVTGLDEFARTQMGDNIDAALDALLIPDRFGAGVEVHVFFTTIYDASDGVGDFQNGGCTVNVNSPSPTDPFFESWNAEIDSRVIAQGQTVADMHDHFYGHGYSNPPNWYAGDCTHPNTLGHEQLQQLFLGLIAGDG